MPLDACVLSLACFTTLYHTFANNVAKTRGVYQMHCTRHRGARAIKKTSGNACDIKPAKLAYCFLSLSLFLLYHHTQSPRASHHLDHRQNNQRYIVRERPRLPASLIEWMNQIFALVQSKNEVVKPNQPIPDDCTRLQMPCGD